MNLEKILETRGIAEEVASRLGWEVSEGWLVMPVIRDGKKVGAKMRKFGNEKAFLQEKGTPQIFYNFDALAAAEYEDLVITEGEMDCAIALQCGFLAVSVPSGAPSATLVADDSKTPSKYAYIEDLPKHTKIVLAFDDDEAGRNLLHDISMRVGKARCRWVKYPKGCKDLNEAFLKYGRKGVEESIKRAQWMEVKGLVKMSDLPPPAFVEAVPCPVAGMAEYYKLRRGDFTVVTGIPGMGKTIFCNEIAASMVTYHGWKVCIASFEQNPRADFEPWLKSYYAKRPADLLADSADVENWIDDNFKLIVPTEDDDIDLPWLVEKIEAAVLRYDCKLVIIDPWNELDHIHFDGVTQTEYTGMAIKKLKKLAAKLKIHMIVVTHPAKMSRTRDGTYPIPSLYDISDSAHWRNKPDMGIIVHRTDDKTSKIIVAKCRYWGKIGKNGEVQLKYDDYLHRFTEI